MITRAFAVAALAALSLTSNNALAPPDVIAAPAPEQIRVEVVDDQGDPVEGAEVRTRYVRLVRQGNKDFPVPTQLSPMAETDSNGRCDLTLSNVSWSTLCLRAHRVELTTEEAMDLANNAPDDPAGRAAFERDLDDRCRRFSSAYLVVARDKMDKGVIKLKMRKAVKVIGRVRVDGKPLAKAFVTISPTRTPVDQFFPRSAPELSDDNGKFSFYSVSGNLNRARIVAERDGGNHVLTMDNVFPKRSPNGLVIDLNTDVNDYRREPKPSFQQP